MTGTSKNKILIAVLSFNEGKNIETTLGDLIQHNFGYDIVVIDDGSQDHTAKVCERLGVPIISHCVNAGNYSNAAMTYFLYAYRRGYEVMCQFDGDGQHVASELPKIINPVLNGESDVVIGSRFIKREGFQSYFTRRLGIRLFSAIDSLVVGHKLTDVTSGFRSYSRRVILYFGHVYKQELYDNTSQFLLIAHFIGAKISEVPIIMRPRVAGQSIFNIVKSITFPLKGLFIVAGCLLERQNLLRRLKNYES